MTPDNEKYADILIWLKQQAKEMGFSDVRVSDLDLSQELPYLQEWLRKGHHGQMHYMSRHANLRANPSILQPGAIRALCFRMDYLPSNQSKEVTDSNASQLLSQEDFRSKEYHRLKDPSQAVVSIYARGRDYHKVLRQNLKKIAQLLAEKIEGLQYRVLVDSAPVMEVALATKSGLGWRGKHTLSLNQDAGSMYFLGEIFVDIPLPLDPVITNHCGSCTACIDLCPTKAIIGPYQLDANKCISYFTIESDQAIPVPLRGLMGNRIYGCDDCQLACPWNKFAKKATHSDFDERNELSSSSLITLFSWTQAEFLEKMRGSAILRIGYERWMRNIAVALGNYLRSKDISVTQTSLVRQLLQDRLGQVSNLVDEHIDWALA